VKRSLLDDARALAVSIIRQVDTRLGRRRFFFMERVTLARYLGKL
jgi:hypothetical protein